MAFWRVIQGGSVFQSSQINAPRSFLYSQSNKVHLRFRQTLPRSEDAQIARTFALLFFGGRAVWIVDGGDGETRVDPVRAKPAYCKARRGCRSGALRAARGSHGAVACRPASRTPRGAQSR